MSNQITDGPAGEPITLQYLNEQFPATCGHIPIIQFFESLQKDKDKLAQDNARQQAVIQILTEALDSIGKYEGWRDHHEMGNIAHDALARADAAGKGEK